MMLPRLLGSDHLICFILPGFSFLTLVLSSLMLNLSPWGEGGLFHEEGAGSDGVPRRMSL